KIHRVLTQYLNLLRTNFTVEEFDAFVPDVACLIGEFGIQPEVAFWISRPSIVYQMTDFDRQAREAAATKKIETDYTPSSVSKSPDGDVDIANDRETAEKEDVPGDDSMAVDEPQSNSDEIHL